MNRDLGPEDSAARAASREQGSKGGESPWNILVVVGWIAAIVLPLIAANH